MHEMKVSVRSLVEYVYRSGSIDSSFRMTSPFSEGTKAHQQVQATYNTQDLKEVTLRTTIDIEDCQLMIEGRCDGILLSKDFITIDEIKSTKGSVEYIEEDSFPVHWAQAKVYAYIYAKEHSLSTIQVQLTYTTQNREDRKLFLKILVWHLR